jgi:hypothetical protein
VRRIFFAATRCEAANGWDYEGYDEAGGTGAEGEGLCG